MFSLNYLSSQTSVSLYIYIYNIKDILKDIKHKINKKIKNINK